MIYNGLCINCRGAISDERLIQVGICENCLESIKGVKSWKYALNALEERGRLYLAGELFDFHNKFRTFSNFFKKAVGQRMWSLQEVWAKRILLGRSFSIVAPTGVGKTVLGIVVALFFAKDKKKSYIIVPTILLTQQVAEKIDSYSKRLGIQPKKICYHTTLDESEKKELLRKVTDGDFDILVTTDRFLTSHFEVLKDKTFDFVFVDDVDSFLKSPRNVDKVLITLGFDTTTIGLASQLVQLRMEVNKFKKIGKSSSEVSAQMEALKNKIEDYKSRSKIGLLVVSGATVRAKRTLRIKLFEELLNFQIGFVPDFVRNIKDFYVGAGDKIESQVLSLIRTFGSGCLVFVPSIFGKEYAIKLCDFLNENGVKACAYVKLDEESLEKFRKGEYEALIGIASFRNPLTRGIDIPERVRYVIFTGVPRTEIMLSWDECNPYKLLTLLKGIRDFLGDRKDEANQIIETLRRIIPLDKQTIEKIKSSIEGCIPLNEYEDRVKKVILEARVFLRSVITPKIIGDIMQSKEISLKKKGEDFYLIIPDPIAYVQASGRSSRMFAGGIARGASFLLVDDEKAFYALRRKLNFLLEEVKWTYLEVKKAERWLKKVDKDRAIIREIKEGKVVKRMKDFIKAALLIVESPTKARTIAKFFGRPYKRKIGNITAFEVGTGEFLLNIMASMGHIYGLVVNEGLHGVKIQNGDFIPIYDFIKKCKKCGENFVGLDFCPKCKGQVFTSKSEIVDAMREIALEMNNIFVATDPDFEGEKIAYDVYCSLYPINHKVERLSFHEVTKKAFLKAIKNRGEINLKMVEAQLIRRIEDRWIGFELSQQLWHKFRNRRLSAGRVQTPVLGWIVERSIESRKKKKVLLATLLNGLTISIENPDIQIPSDQLEKRINELKARVIDLKNEEKRLKPPPPYATHTLLYDASDKLGFTATKTMTLAQDLFETGLCTYHRTDSTTVSDHGISVAKEYIYEKYPSLFTPRRYLMEGTHECVRPTRPLDSETLKNLISIGFLRLPKKLTNDHLKLYDLIFKRFIASQMKEVRVLYQQFRVLIDGNTTFVENPVSVLSEGFNVVLPIKTTKAVQEGVYPLKFARFLYLPAVRLFTEGDVIDLMKERGVGRPSTYARIVATILERGYAIEKKNRLISTTLGFKVFKYLSSKFGKYTSESATKELESIMDMVEQGKVNYKDVLRELYQEILEIRKA